VSDDTFDPDSQQFTLDPALDTIVDFTGTAKLVVTSFPDEDIDGVGGLTTGPYWMRVDVVPDADGDGLPDAHDPCPNDFGDDSDGDGLCADNCPDVSNIGQGWRNGDCGKRGLARCHASSVTNTPMPVNQRQCSPLPVS